MGIRPTLPPYQEAHWYNDFVRGEVKDNVRAQNAAQAIDGNLSLRRFFGARKQLRRAILEDQKDENRTGIRLNSVDMNANSYHSNLGSSNVEAPAPQTGYGSGMGSASGTTGAGGGRPETIIEKITQFFYKEGEGVQYSNIVGGLGGAALAASASGYMVEAAGMSGGWLGTIATVIMAGAGLIGGAQAFSAIAEYMNTPKAPAPTTTPSTSAQPAKIAAQDAGKEAPGNEKEMTADATTPANVKSEDMKFDPKSLFTKTPVPTLKGVESVLYTPAPVDEYVSLRPTDTSAAPKPKTEVAQNTK